MWRAPVAWRSVHPRWRGEHLSSRGCRSAGRGSSPLARGTRRARTASAALTGFIPAGAGNTFSLRLSRVHGAVHPRWRGEHTGGYAANPSASGSSPLARGTPEYRLECEARWRFIPAGAGNTALVIASMLALAVHPRWRGEHATLFGVSDRQVGSSPLARGTLIPGAGLHLLARFIPAGAGNTISIQIRQSEYPVHPRWRGEHLRLATRVWVRTGSSPLARGTLQASTEEQRRGRFIPAGAGNTLIASPRSAGTPVHPRWRGEHSITATGRLAFVGSSPLARGTHYSALSMGGISRFIPAGAGNTRR